MKERQINCTGFSHHILMPLVAIIGVAVVGVYMLSLSSAATIPGDAVGVKAKRTADFINSQGVVAHVDEDSYTDKDNVLAALRYVGIKHIRSGYTQEGPVRTWLAQNGIKTSATTLTPEVQPLSADLMRVDTSIENRITDLLTRPLEGNKYAASTTFLEPFNEYDKKGAAIPPEDPAWTDTLLYAQQQLWNNKSRIAEYSPLVKVLGPSVVGYRAKVTLPELQAKNLGAYMDFGNIHSYYGGSIPETTLEADDGLNGFMTTTPPITSANLQERLQLYSTYVSGTKRIVVTEMGYHDYMDVEVNDHKPTDSQAVGIYMPRAYLENFRIGVVRTYAYQLFDEIEHTKEYEKHFGMFYTDGVKGGEPKPSAQAMNVMNTILNDAQTGAGTFKTAKLNYRINDNNVPPNVRTLLLQKKSGKFYLAVWTNDSVYDVVSRQYTDPPAPTPLTLTFGRARTVTAYYDGSATPTVVGSGKLTYPIHASAKVSIFEIQ